MIRGRGGGLRSAKKHWERAVPLGGHGATPERSDQDRERELGVARSKTVAKWLKEMQHGLRAGEMGAAIHAFVKASSYVEVSQAVALSRALRAAGRYSDAAEVFEELQAVGRREEIDGPSRTEHAVALASANRSQRAVDLVGNGRDELIRVITELTISGQPDAIGGLLKSCPELASRGTVCRMAALVKRCRVTEAGEVLIHWYRSDEDAAHDIASCAARVLMAAASLGRCERAFEAVSNEDKYPEIDQLEAAGLPPACKLLHALVVFEGSCVLGRLWDPWAEPKRELLHATRSLLMDRPANHTPVHVWDLCSALFTLDVEDLNTQMSWLSAAATPKDGIARMRQAKMLRTAAWRSHLIVPDTNTCRLTLTICYRSSGRWLRMGRQAWAVLDEMERVGVLPDQKSVVLAISCAGMQGGWGLAEKLYERYAKGRLDKHHMASANSALLMAYAIAGKTQQCKHLFHEMAANDAPLREDCYGHLLQCLAKEGDPAVMQVLEAVQGSGQFTGWVRTVAFAKMVTSLAVANKKSIIRDILDKYGPLIASFRSPVVFNVIIEAAALSFQDRWLAKAAVDVMEEHRAAPDRGTYVGLACVSCTLRFVKGARVLLEAGARRGGALSPTQHDRLVQSLAIGHLFDESVKLAALAEDGPFAQDLFDDEVRTGPRAWTAVVKGCLSAMRRSPAGNAPGAEDQVRNSYKLADKTTARSALLTAELALVQLAVDAGSAPNWLFSKVILAAYYADFPELVTRLLAMSNITVQTYCDRYLRGISGRKKQNPLLPPRDGIRAEAPLKLPASIPRQRPSTEHRPIARSVLNRPQQPSATGAAQNTGSTIPRLAHRCIAGGISSGTTTLQTKLPPHAEPFPFQSSQCASTAPQ